MTQFVPSAMTNVSAPPWPKKESAGGTKRTFCKYSIVLQTGEVRPYLGAYEEGC